jgi:hypothetical protein
LLGRLIAAAFWRRKALAAAVPLCAIAFDIDDGKASPLCGGGARPDSGKRAAGSENQPRRLNAPGAASVVQGERAKKT